MNQNMNEIVQAIESLNTKREEINATIRERISGLYEEIRLLENVIGTAAAETVKASTTVTTNGNGVHKTAPKVVVGTLNTSSESTTTERRKPGRPVGAAGTTTEKALKFISRRTNGVTPREVIDATGAHRTALIRLVQRGVIRQENQPDGTVRYYPKAS